MWDFSINPVKTSQTSQPLLKQMVTSPPCAKFAKFAKFGGCAAPAHQAKKADHSRRDHSRRRKLNRHTKHSHLSTRRDSPRGGPDADLVRARTTPISRSRTRRQAPAQAAGRATPAAQSQVGQGDPGIAPRASRSRTADRVLRRADKPPLAGQARKRPRHRHRSPCDGLDPCSPLASRSGWLPSVVVPTSRSRTRKPN